MKNHRLQKLSITSFLVFGIFSSSAFADINHITGNATSTINVSLSVPPICNIVGLDDVENKVIDPTSGRITIPGIRSSCNGSEINPKISFVSKNDYALVSQNTKSNSATVPYNVTFGTTSINGSTAAITITDQPTDLTMSIDPVVLENKTPDTYSDILTATISL